MALIKQMVSAGIQSHRAQATLGSVATGLTAAGTNLATGLALKSAVNVFGTVAASTGAVLPVAGLSDEVVVNNGGANALLVYPATAAGTVGAGGAGVGFSVAAGKTASFKCVSTSGLVWIALLSA